MGIETFIEDFRRDLEFEPIPGELPLFTMKPRVHSEPSGPAMTCEDWDKFERDIAEAFEQVP